MDLNDLTLSAYQLAILMFVTIIPIMIMLFAIRLVGRSAKKTIRSIQK